MDALIKQLVEALVLSRLALDRLDDGIPFNTAEIARVKEMAEAAIQAAISYELGRTLLSESQGRATTVSALVDRHSSEVANRGARSRYELADHVSYGVGKLIEKDS